MRWGTSEAEALAQRVADQAREIAELQAAMYTLVGLEMSSNCPQSVRGGVRSGVNASPMATLEPFVTRRTFDGASISKWGVGDPSKK